MHWKSNKVIKQWVNLKTQSPGLHIWKQAMEFKSWRVLELKVLPYYRVPEPKPLLKIGVLLFSFGVPLKMLVSPWTTTLPGIIGIVRTDHIQTLPSAEMSLVPRSTSLAWGRRRWKWMGSPYVAMWCQMTRSSSPLQLWSLPIFVSTSKWWKAMAKMVFTSDCSSTLSMSSVSTR